jgi:transcriptional regulator with XRE-family HTH domain
VDENITLGRRLKRLRTEKGLTQEQLADAADVSLVMIAKTEQDKRHPLPPLLHRIADALDVNMSELIDRRPALGTRDAGVLALRDALQSPAAVPGMDGEDAAPATVQEMRAEADAATRDYWDGNLAGLLATLPGLIRRARATRDAHGPAAAVPLALAYDRAAGVLVHFGREDLSVLAAERAACAAADGDDEQLLATMHATYAWALLHQGRLAEAERIAAEAAQRVAPRGRASDRDLAVYGNILMTAVSPAAAAGGDVSGYITEAAGAAGRAAGPVWLWATSFSASSVAVQACHAAAVKREPGKALEAAGRVNPGDLPGTISRGRHLLDIAQAHVDSATGAGAAGHAQAATAVLTQAHRMAPAWFRHQEIARVLVADLLERSTRTPRALRVLAGAADVGGYASYYRPPR